MWGMKAEERISARACGKIREAIADAEGNEVVLAAWLDGAGTVDRVEVVSRGDVESAPAVLRHLERVDVVIHNHPSGVLAPSKADLSVAGILGEEGVGFYIVDNEVRHVYVVVEPLPERPLTPLPEEELAALLSPGGPFSAMPHYEYREAQVGLLREVVRAFNDDGILVAEAGTGIGKSYAYLIPALLWGTNNEERVVVSTATITLQQQLVEKDIPYVQKVLGTRVKVTLVKGRQNYLCRHRLAEVLEEGAEDLFADPDLLKALADWAVSTPTGDRADIPFHVPDEVWGQVCSEAELCMGLRCPDRERCFVLRVRKEAAASRLLVVNHHLLFSDLSMRMEGRGFDTAAVLPGFSRLILDEAHNLEDSASSFFSQVLSPEGVLRVLRRIHSRGRRGAKGVLRRLEKTLGGLEQAEEWIADLNRIAERAEALRGVWLALLPEEGTVRMDGDAVSRCAPGFESLFALQEEILGFLGEVDRLIKSLDEAMKDHPAVQEFLLHVRRLRDVARFCQAYRDRADAEQVYWVERVRRTRGEPSFRLVITPLDPGALLREHLYEAVKTLVFTSATLTVGGSFTFWEETVGLVGMGDRLRERAFPSPFPYEEHVLLSVPTDAPPPEDAGYQAYLSSLLKEVLVLSEGHALVLFTSYRMLEDTYRDVAPVLLDHNLLVLKQGEDERSRLLSRFKEIPASILFGTESFWEGVDVPGEALQLVVLCRLPFRVPSHPVLQARVERLAAEGKSPFYHRQLPEAIMRFKQGFGRLMRRTTDRGVVLVTDSRIVSRSYGRLFLSSIPRTRLAVTHTEGVLREMERFLYPG
ncbi:hypothetical protein STHERM_c05470 [Spirochaeta thermophila DSM 6192]|uniref:Helicase ATP-binding domain-containing protein n=2 Tax=Winmispira thermophila TaxID=154 RepID=E0RQL2_WINT6|nr:hypothetical protein STHERM_c05470 [Spirochaeta thermophila DSM 6192]